MTTWHAENRLRGRVSSSDGAPVTRDHLAEGMTMRKGLTGAKPDRFCVWVLAMLGYMPGEDTVTDLFPGTGVMGLVVDRMGDELPFTAEVTTP